MFPRIAAAASVIAFLFGPPSIHVDAVTNPATAPVKGALFMLTAHHHQETAGVTITGRAEGLVSGKRVTRPLTLTPAAGDGVYGVTRQWDAGQPWLLVFTIDAPSHDSSGYAEAVVRIAPDGKTLGIDYPLGKLASGTPWPRRISAKEIDVALEAMARR